MKTFKKVLASTLAAAMVVTALPVTPANAAAAPKLSATKATLYTGQSKTLKVTTPKAWKSVKVKATTSKKSVATVKASKKKVTVKAVKAGTAKVTVKVTAKKAKKTVKKTLKATITVKNPALAVSAADVLAIGSTETIKATVKPANAKVSYKTSDATIATVDAKGVVTGVKAGDVTITVSAKSGNKTVSKDVKMTVKKAILKDATQTEVTKVVATVAGDTKDLKAGDFKVTNTATNATVAVKAATADKKDPSKVTIETFTEMKDAKEYTVVYDGVTVKFTATDGTPSKVGLDTAQIPAASKTKVQATLADVNGVILGRTDLDNSNTSKGQVTSAVTLTKGYQDGTNLYLPAVGDTATVKVTYHTGTFGTDGKEAGNIEDTFTVTAVDPSLVNYNFAVTIGTNPAWTAASFKANDKIAMGADKDAYFRITKDDGTEIAAENYADYTVESADKTKLIVNNTKLTSSSTGVKVHGVAEGTTYILVKKDDKTVASLPVTVQGKPVAQTLELSTTSVTVATGASVAENVKLTLKDQYGDAMDITDTAVAVLGKPNDSTIAASDFTKPAVSGKSATFTVTGDAFDAQPTGSYSLKLSAKDNTGKTIDRTLTINVVKKATTAQAYQVRVDNAEVDTTVGRTDTVAADSKQINISVAKLSNGAAIGLADKAIYTIKNAKGDVVAHVGDDVTTGALDAGKVGDAKTNAAVDDSAYTGGKLTVTPYTVSSSGDTMIVKNLPAGTYNVEAKVWGDNDKLVTVNGTFTIKDTQESGVSFKLLNNSFKDASGNAITVREGFADSTKVEVYYDGQKQDNTKLTASDVKGVVLTSGNGGAYIKTVKVFVNVSGTEVTTSANYVQVTLTVNDQLAVVAAGSGETAITE